ncbi:MAG: hypothetical protein JXC31_05750 [Acholeplasmataceae bacterium]|nr:hypothetical protein [Acholeplasmataceae bacterium]
MNLLDQFRQPIHKKDLMPVIRLGIFMSLIGGLMIGALHLLIVQVFGVSLVWMLLFFFGYYLARRIRASFDSYHIWYSIIAILTIVVTFYFLNIIYYFGLFFIVDALTILPLGYLFNPLTYFSFLNIFSPGFFITENLLDVVFFLIVIIYTSRYIK